MRKTVSNGKTLTYVLLSALVLSGLNSPCLAQYSEMVPPEVILPTPDATTYTPAAQSASPSGSVGQPGQAVPGQVQMGSAARGFAPVGGFTPQPGQPNPFAMRPVDMMRRPAGVAFPGAGSNPNAQGGMQGAPPAGSSALLQNPPGAGTSLQALNMANAQAAAQNSVDPTCTIETSKGRIVIRLFQQYAPITVKAFTEMANHGFYNGLNFHRVEPGFVIQGGCPNGDGTGNYTPPGAKMPRFLPLEASPFLKHNAAGVVAMARQPQNVNTSSCQFYITLAPQVSLDQKYTVFGGVLQCMEVVRSIAKGDRIISVSVSQP